MLSYNRIRKISEMFDPSIQIYQSVSLHDHMVDFEDDLDWKMTYNTLDIPQSDFYSAVEEFDFSRLDEEPLSPQSQIRNHDCMWSGRCTTHPNECLSSRNNCNTKYVNENKTNQQQANQQNTVQSQQNTQQQTTFNQQKKQQQQNIPAGRSLLRLNHVKPSVIKVPNVSTNDFLKDRDYIARPDTPLSLDDDVPEFKHTIDLAACTMGSNKMSLLTESPTEIINIMKEHLEDTSSNRIPKVFGYMSGIKSADAFDEVMKDIRTLSDYEDELDDEDADESDATNDSFNISCKMVSLQSNQQSQASLLISSSAQHSTTTYENTQSMHSDHSYTRCKRSPVDIVNLGVQTPSDSEEEIDVVSVGDKNLPTNPSAKDRRALQTTVAHKITSRMVKTPNGQIRAIARRRVSNGSSDDSAYSSKSSSGVQSSTAGSPIRLVSPPNGASRKRVANSQAAMQSAKRTKLSKKVSNQSLSSLNGSPNVSRISFNASNVSTSSRRSGEPEEELETIEKRNLHNDMERQRRIGLKNLFENLKDKIPSLREKDRAPKVNILREATSLCNKLTHDDLEYEQQMKRRNRLQQKLKQLRQQLAMRGMY